MRPVLDITPGQSLDNAVAWMASRPAFAPISVFFRAVAVRRIGLTIIFDHRAAWTPRAITSEIPRIVLILDDYGQSRDPAEWRCGISAIAWARTAVIHGAGGLVEHYRTAVLSAAVTGRCLFVETDSACAPAWAAAIEPRQIPCLVIVPPSGGLHPAEAEATTP
jgi:hypothetical protein